MLSQAIVNTNNPIQIRDTVHRNPQIGVDYIPPLNAKAEIVVKEQSLEQKQESIQNWTEFTYSKLPKSFSWRSSADIKKYHGWKPKGQILTKPTNQWSCGCCWAIASVTMHADRVALWSQQRIRPLSVSFVMSCMPDSLKCDGGFPSSVGKFLEMGGTVDEKCFPYSWCSQSAECKSGASNDNNQLIPKCTNSCVNTNVKKRVSPRAIPGSTIAITDQESIQLEILRYGPVVAVFRVFVDFLLGKPKNAWKKTDNIYVHVPNQVIYSERKSDLIQNICNSKNPNQCYVGNHAVVIVGWGSKQLKKPLQLQNQKITHLKYWIVRNSWGSSWNGDGYFNVAFSDPNTGINMALAMDRPLRINQKKFGGVTTWFPDVPLKGPLKQLVQQYKSKVVEHRQFDKKLFLTAVMITVLVLILVCIVIAVWYSFHRSKLSK